MTQPQIRLIKLTNECSLAGGGCSCPSMERMITRHQMLRIREEAESGGNMAGIVNSHMDLFVVYQWYLRTDVNLVNHTRIRE